MTVNHFELVSNFDMKTSGYLLSQVLTAAIWKKWFRPGGQYHSQVRLNGKTVIITGANTGIGKETARDLYLRGAHVVMACRDLKKAEAALKEILKSAEGKNGKGTLVVRDLDLTSLDSIRKCANKILETEERIDILINNAGVMMCPYMKTQDGFEMQIGVNHLGHFLFTNLLLDRIKASVPARIVNVSSSAHLFGKINFEDINAEKSYNRVWAYGQSKLANILFTRELARQLRGTQVTAYSLHPGAVDTELQRHVERAIYQIVTRFVNKFLLPIFYKTPVEGAQTTIYCAVAEELEGKSGLYYADCKEKTPSSRAVNDEDAKRLWEISSKMVGISNS